MTITRKEIKTEIHVEISRDEYVENYHNMMNAIINKEWYDSRVNENTIKEQLDSYISKNDHDKNLMANDSFTALFGLIHSAVIRYIAQSNGMEVDNYGYVNSPTDTLEALFWVRGAHL